MNRRDAMIEYIEARLVSTPGPLDTNCRIWTGGDSGDGRGGGYPRMTFEGETYAVHRTYWQLVNGVLLPKWQLDHLCKTRMCCEPLHLEKVSHICNQHRRSFPALESQMLLGLEGAA